MKRIFKYTLLYTLASFIFYGGSGVNLINYCCGDCLKAGIEAVTSQDCCSTHNHDLGTSPKQDHALSINGVHDCGIERIEFSWTTGENDRTFHLEPVITDVLFPVLSNSLSAKYGVSDMVLYTESNPPPINLPREYLTLLTVLLI